MSTNHTALAGRTVLVLGAAGQVGALVVDELHARGAHVLAVSRRRERLDALIARLQTTGRSPGSVIPVTGALSDAAAAQRLRDDVLAAAPGTLDGVVASLGGWRAGVPLVDVTVEDWNRVLTDNLTSHFVAARTFLPVLADQGGGAYISISGPAGEIVRPGTGPVSTAVAGQRMLNAALKLETADTRVSVDEIVFSGAARRPGWVDAAHLGPRIAELVGTASTTARSQV
jgi:3-oxoacyl-[acyl-carrier protein] reductase